MTRAAPLSAAIRGRVGRRRLTFRHRQAKPLSQVQPTGRAGQGLLFQQDVLDRDDDDVIEPAPGSDGLLIGNAIGKMRVNHGPQLPVQSEPMIEALVQSVWRAGHEDCVFDLLLNKRRPDAGGHGVRQVGRFGDDDREVGELCRISKGF